MSLTYQDTWLIRRYLYSLGDLLCSTGSLLGSHDFVFISALKFDSHIVPVIILLLVGSKKKIQCSSEVYSHSST